ncbi:hypothetical protein [Commensalibacter oyaizuii]|uniref:Lipoprotein n=1 Tax=Commensalibacter oyaizuii TaxID=3043873 RepID=A0ABT6Q171_9PROT|nr:hypothetical protein [Commensalibacter sp. TBRC 16381]MDI2090862.1 hypothetical protein [Commensalibacter sp. TBRC 16381]
MKEISFFRVSKIVACLLSFTPLIGCMTVPHPFEKQAGNKGGVLSNPPPARLIVPVPTESLLNDKESAVLAHDIAKAMLDQTVPAVVGKAQKGEWLLVTKVENQGDMVVPKLSIISPDGKVQATRDAMPVSTKDWASGNEAIYAQVAQQAAPIVNEVLTGLQARQMVSDPHSLKNRPAQIYFEGVKGAPGDGNTVIARQFVVSLNDKLNAIQQDKSKADYSVGCNVSVTNGAAGTRGNPVQHVEVVWRIVDKKGKEAGKVTQINDVPAHSLDVYWGDTGSAVGEEAAGGIKRVIDNYSGRNNRPLAENGGMTKAPLVTPPGLQN